MRHAIRTALALALILHAPAALAAGKRAAHPAIPASPNWPGDEREAIAAVIEAFRLAIIAHDGAALSDLMIDSRATFNMIGGQDFIDDNRKYDRTYSGIGSSGFPAFSRYVTNTKDQIEERFRNIRIEQDGPLALVRFDYDFLANGTVENGGIEHWMLRKVDGKWKIFSVVWTQRPGVGEP